MQDLKGDSLLKPSLSASRHPFRSRCHKQMAILPSDRICTMAALRMPSEYSLPALRQTEWPMRAMPRLS